MGDNLLEREVYAGPSDLMKIPEDLPHDIV
jgi:hypothetical protein